MLFRLTPSLLAALLFSTTSFAGESRESQRAQLKQTLTDVLGRSALRSGRVAVHVQSLEGGDVVFAHNAHDLLNPASNVKLFTAAAALVRLGPEYRFETEILAEGNVYQNGGRVKTLFVRGKGDPSFTTERMYSLVSELQHAGLREVQGDLVIDDSFFDGERTPAGFDQETSDRSYMAPTGAVSLNWNAAGIYLRPGEVPGGRAVVELEPASDFFAVENGAVTGNRRRRRFSVSSEPMGERQRIVVRGTLPAGGGPVSVWKKIDNPPMYFGQTLKTVLAQRGIRVKGKVRVGLVTPSARLVYVAQSDTLDMVLKRLNKVSSNFVAEQLLKTLGAEGRGLPGSFQKGIDVVEEFLQNEVGIPRGSYVMKNGSGLNDANRFSAAQLSKLLRYMFERFPLSPEYLSSLGIAGKDGTLRYRFEGSDAVGRLRAKTGTLERVSALSGYVQAVGGEKFVFSVMVNEYQGRAGPVIQGIDALGAAVAASGSVGGPTTAVAELMRQERAPGTLEEVKARVKTYLALTKQGDPRNLNFLRSAWRSEKDPAVRAVVAESIYQSNPQDHLGARALLDSFAANDEVYGTLRRVAKDLGVEVPGVGSVVDMAAEGNFDALKRVLELARATGTDDEARTEMSLALSEVARTAPEELLHAMKDASATEREAATQLLARGLANSQDAAHPFWPVLRKSVGSVDGSLAAFAKKMDGDLSMAIAAEKAPREGKPDEPPSPSTLVETRPGG